jgi:hypothetical protein
MLEEKCVQQTSQSNIIIDEVASKIIENKSELDARVNG